ncbi:hypothetical protein KP509_22G017400 [Ceratopteris richardii]|nr:hypothetical protein KP509_22G017400 [Ceratopteris richardii]KAH7306535.1 hypothetical protein KP509_22G017400 [Ceratopteris richardii]
MEKIVNRYHRYEGRPQFTYSQSRAPQNVHWIKQAIDIKSPTEVLDGIQSDLAADKVPGVSVRELQNAELRLETLRTEIRKRKGRLLASQMQHILNQERAFDCML